MALAQFFAVGCAEYIALRFAVGSPGLAPRSGYTRRRLGQARPPWPLGRGDRGLLAPGAAAPRGGYPAGRPVGFASRSPLAGGELVPPRAAEWLHPQAGWSGGRRHLRGRSEDIQQWVHRIPRAPRLSSPSRFEVARGISSNECSSRPGAPPGDRRYPFRVLRASPGAHRHLWARPEDLPCGSRPPNPFPAMSAPPGALIASGGHLYHRVPVATSGPARRIYPAARAPLTHFQQ